MVHERLRPLVAGILVLGFIAAAGSRAWASFVLSLGTFSKADAESMHKQLSSRGYPVYLLYGETYEVRLGGFESREKAEEMAEKLKSEEKIVVRVQEEEDLDQYQATWEAAPGEGKEVNDATTQEYHDPQAQKIVSFGLELFGHPYKYGGTKIGKGIDCSFFTQTIFKEMGISLPRTSGEQFKVGREVSPSTLKVGDLLFFKKTYYSKKKKGGRRRGVTRINHVGIYIGNGEFIHATLNVNRVTISRLAEDYFTKRFAGARRVLRDSN